MYFMKKKNHPKCRVVPSVSTRTVVSLCIFCFQHHIQHHLDHCVFILQWQEVAERDYWWLTGKTVTKVFSRVKKSVDISLSLLIPHFFSWISSISAVQPFKMQEVIQIGRQAGNWWQGVAYSFPYSCSVCDRNKQTKEGGKKEQSN